MSSPSPQISVIIPVYNDVNTVRHSILSVFEQSYTDYEVIVVDDGSDDDISGALKDLVRENLHILKHDKNQGAAAARNTGIQAAKGAYVAFLDSDDIWLPNKLKQQYEYMSAQGKESKVHASCTSFKMVGLSQRKSTRILKRSKDWNAAMLAGCTVSPGSTLMAKRHIFLEGDIGLLPTQLRRLEDWDWLLSYVSKYDLGIVEEVLSEVRVSGYPKYNIVERSASALKDRKSDFVVENFGQKKLSLFLAGLEVEKAWAAFRQRQYLKAARHIFMAAFISPKRFMMFAKKALQKLRERL